MLRKLPFLLTLALTWTLAAQAQFSLTVLAPSSVAGVVPGTVGPDDTWGFGPANALTPVTGFCQWASPDTLALNMANVTGPTGVGDLTGKVAVVKRGTILRSIKVRRCERAGAIAVIIVNDGSAMPSILGSEDSGVITHIPVILVPKEWGDANRALIGTGTVQVQIGNVRGHYANNLTIATNSLFIPKNYATPANMVADTGDFKFRVGGAFQNYGSAAQGPGYFKAEVIRVSPNPARLWADSHAVAGVTVTDSISQDFPEFDLIRADPSAAGMMAHYQLVYTIYASGVQDDNPTDNRAVADFYLTDVSFSKSALNMDPTSANYLLPPAAIAYSIAGGGAFKWGQYYRTGSVGDTATDVTFAVTTSTTTPLAGQSIDLELSQWNDVNNDGGITDDEVVLLGSGTYSFSQDADRYVFKTARLQNNITGEDGIILQPFSKYLIMVSYSGTDQVYFAASETPNYLPYVLQDTTSSDWYFPLYNGTNYTVFGNGNGGFASSLVSIRLDFNHLNATAVRPIAKLDSRLSLYPNPAQGQVRLSLEDKAGSGKAEIRVRDMAGHTVLNRTEQLQGKTSHFTLTTSSLAPGLYQVEVGTAQGVASQKLVLVR